MMSRRYLFLFAVVIMLALFLVACSIESRPTFTKAGILRDTIFSVEPRGNGATVLWMTHDDVSAYCFAGSIPDAKKLIDHSGEIVLHYTSIADMSSICWGVESSTTVYLVSEYSLVAAR